MEIGRSASVADEPLRFRPDLSLAHPSSDVSSVERITGPDGEDRLLVETTFLGLYGTMSPLPSSYAEDVLHDHSEESLVRGFLDIFHHRLIALFYRCWKKYRHHVQYRKGAQDEFSRRLLSLAGLDVEQLGNLGHSGFPLFGQSILVNDQQRGFTCAFVLDLHSRGTG